jgi:hypothetical protein
MRYSFVLSFASHFSQLTAYRNVQKAVGKALKRATMARPASESSHLASSASKWSPRTSTPLTLLFMSHNTILISSLSLSLRASRHSRAAGTLIFLCVHLIHSFGLMLDVSALARIPCVDFIKRISALSCQYQRVGMRDVLVELSTLRRWRRHNRTAPCR